MLDLCHLCIKQRFCLCLTYRHAYMQLLIPLSSLLRVSMRLTVCEATASVAPNYFY